MPFRSTLTACHPYTQTHRWYGLCGVAVMWNILWTDNALVLWCKVSRKWKEYYTRQYEASSNTNSKWSILWVRCHTHIHTYTSNRCMLTCSNMQYAIGMLQTKSIYLKSWIKCWFSQSITLEFRFHWNKYYDLFTD